MAQFTRNKQVQDEFRRAVEAIGRDWSLDLERHLLDIREKISQQMRRKKLSRADVARILNSSRAYVTQLLSGNQNIRLSTLFKISFALGLRPRIQFVDEDKNVLNSFFESAKKEEGFESTVKSEKIVANSKILNEVYERTA